MLAPIGARTSDRQLARATARLLPLLATGGFLALARGTRATRSDGLGAVVRACQENGLHYWQHVIALTPGLTDGNESAARSNAKSQVACSYPTVVPLTTTLWKCDEEPQPDRAALDDHEWGCEAVQNTEEVAVAGSMNAWSDEVMAPKANTVFISPDGKWFISSAMCPYATPQERFTPAFQLS